MPCELGFPPPHSVAFRPPTPIETAPMLPDDQKIQEVWSQSACRQKEAPLNRNQKHEFFREYRQTIKGWTYQVLKEFLFTITPGTEQNLLTLIPLLAQELCNKLEKDIQNCARELKNARLQNRPDQINRRDFEKWYLEFSHWVLSDPKKQKDYAHYLSDLIISEWKCDISEHKSVIQKYLLNTFTKEIQPFNDIFK